MAIEVVVPRLGWSMDEGTFGQWLKRDGEFVERGQALFVLEGEKAAQDIESFDQGILRIPADAPQPGDVVKVGQVLAFLVDKGDRAPFEEEGAALAKPQVSTSPDRAMAPSPTLAVSRESATRSLHTRSRANATPRARRLAEQLGVDWTTLNGSGRAGRVRERDVAKAASDREGAKPQASEGGLEQSRETKDSRAPLAVSRLRQTIASRMSAGAHETAPVTLTTRCDATNLVALREQFKAARREDDEAVPGYSDLIVKLSAVALERHPLLAAQWNEGKILPPAGFHIAVAVDTEGGLMAPVIRDVDRLSVRQVASEMRKLADLARTGKLSASQMQGGVFTVTNLGMFGVETFTPIINLPQCAILGVGRIVLEPALLGERIVPREQVSLSLTFDHRLVDGAPAARFFQELCTGIANPAAWLVT
jgi:pyruvate dehydrogenase E2 component (dihydrolipoamide acetyltransferase)